MATANYQGRTKNEEHKSGSHSLYKIWFVEIDPITGIEQNPRYFLSFYNRTFQKKALSSVKDSIKNRVIKIAKLIDNQKDSLLEVYEDGNWRPPNNAEVEKHNNNRLR